MTTRTNYNQLSREIGLTCIAPSIDLKDRVVVITGGADGIGGALTRAAHLHGATVVAVDKQAEKLHALKKEFRSKRFVGIERDLLKPMDQEFRDALTEVCSRLGKVDSYVMNAGAVRLGEGAKNLMDPKCPQEIRDLFQLNAVNHLEIFQILQPQLVKSDAGRIVVVSSPIVGRPDTSTAGYAVSKKVLEILTSLMKAELKDAKNVKINGCVPPPVQNYLCAVLKPKEPVGATPNPPDVTEVLQRLISADLLPEYDGQMLVFQDKRFPGKTPAGDDFRWNERTENGYNMDIKKRPLNEGGGTEGTVIVANYDTWDSRRLMNERPAPAIDFSRPLRDVFLAPVHDACVPK